MTDDIKEDITQEATPAPEEKLTPLKPEEMTGFLEAEKRNLDLAKKEKQDAQSLKLAAAETRARAEEDAKRIREEAQKEADTLKQGVTAKARRQFAKEALDNGTFEPEQYNAYLERHGLNRAVTMDDLEDRLAARDRELVEAIKRVIPAPPTPETRQHSDRLQKSLDTIVAVGLDQRTAKAVLQAAYENDPDNFTPEIVAKDFVAKFGQPIKLKEEPPKDAKPDDQETEKRRKGIFSFMEK